MARNTSEEFDELHARTTRILNKMLEAAENGMLVVGTDDEGRPLIGMPPPALLAQAIKFLKENGVDRPAAATKKVDVLKNILPDSYDDDDDNIIPFHSKITN